MRRLSKLILSVLLLLLVLGLVFVWYSYKSNPAEITYGMSFNTPYARELGLDWQVVYDAILDDLQVRHLRLAAHWDMVEPNNDVYNFAELDYQLKRAEEVGAEVVFAVGRRLPRWPECHEPTWAKKQTKTDHDTALLTYIETVINRYKNNPAITYWQVENEPYLGVFASEQCGEFDETLFEKELALVKKLDPSRPILVTDSGNLGTWAGAYRHGDAFGTSVYIYFWNPDFGQFRTIIPPWVYWLKEGLMRLIYGPKETMLIELSAEPWLPEPVVEVDIATQLSRMDITKFNEILDYAARTRYPKQYLWGAEWWYWMREHGHNEFWQRGQELFPSVLPPQL